MLGGYWSRSWDWIICSQIRNIVFTLERSWLTQLLKRYDCLLEQHKKDSSAYVRKYLNFPQAPAELIMGYVTIKVPWISPVSYESSCITILRNRSQMISSFSTGRMRTFHSSRWLPVKTVDIFFSEQYLMKSLAYFIVKSQAVRF